MELILGIILLLIVVLKVGGEKASIKAYDERQSKTHDRWKAEKQLWEAKVVSKQLQFELEDMINDPDKYDSVWSEVSEAFKDIPCYSDYDSLPLFESDVLKLYGKAFTKKQREVIAQSNRELALRIMLAKRGKLRVFDALFGIHTIGCEMDTGNRDAWDHQRTFVQWLSKELKSHGISEKLCFEDIRMASGKMYSFDNVEHYAIGVYMWEPIVPPGKVIN